MKATAYVNAFIEMLLRKAVAALIKRSPFVEMNASYVLPLLIK